MFYRKTPDPRIILSVLACVIVLILVICRVIYIENKQPSEEIYRIPVLNHSGEIENIELEGFIIGVVAAEAPASFEPEALKAQAVAARTYVLAHCPPYGQYRHEKAAVCCDSTHCQAYLTKEEMAARWQKNYDEYYQKIQQAVEDTAGEILFWQGNIAQTPFFSTCGGSTESAAACWGNEVPYLTAIDCGYCADSPRFCCHKIYSLAQAASLLNTDVANLSHMYAESYTASGRIKQINIGDKLISGTDIRSILGLNSTAFTWLILGDNIIFASIGNGHGVGLCQYGANGMAKHGHTYAEILFHYYPGTALGMAKTP